MIIVLCYFIVALICEFYIEHVFKKDKPDRSEHDKAFDTIVIISMSFIWPIVILLSIFYLLGPKTNKE